LYSLIVGLIAGFAFANDVTAKDKSTDITLTILPHMEVSEFSGDQNFELDPEAPNWAQTVTRTFTVDSNVDYDFTGSFENEYIVGVATNGVKITATLPSNLSADENPFGAKSHTITFGLTNDGYNWTTYEAGNSYSATYNITVSVD